MPIPLLVPPQENSSASERSHFYLVPKLEAEWIGAPFFPRAVIHFFDVLVIQGFSLYFSKVISLLLTAYHLPEIKESGRQVAGKLFQETFGYGKGTIGVAVFLFLSLFFFVALPRLTGRTLGMGLFGYRLATADGAIPSAGALLLRWVGCLMVYATGGMMLLPLLKKTPRPLFQDRVSQTRVVKVAP